MCIRIYWTQCNVSKDRGSAAIILRMIDFYLMWHCDSKCMNMSSPKPTNHPYCTCTYSENTHTHTHTKTQTTLCNSYSLSGFTLAGKNIAPLLSCNNSENSVALLLFIYCFCLPLPTLHFVILRTFKVCVNISLKVLLIFPQSYIC